MLHAQSLCLCQRELFHSPSIDCLYRKTISTNNNDFGMKRKPKGRANGQWRFSFRRKCIVCSRNEQRFEKIQIIVHGAFEAESLLNKRTGQIMVSTDEERERERESPDKPMECQTHFKGAQRTQVVLRLSSMSIRSHFFTLCLRSQYVIAFTSSSFGIITLIIDILDEQKNKFPIRIVCASDKFDADYMIVVIIIIIGTNAGICWPKTERNKIGDLVGS